MDWEYSRSQRRHTTFILLNNKEVELWITPFAPYNTSQENIRGYVLFQVSNHACRYEFIAHAKTVKKLKEKAEALSNES